MSIAKIPFLSVGIFCFSGRDRQTYPPAWKRAKSIVYFIKYKTYRLVAQSAERRKSGVKNLCLLLFCTGSGPGTVCSGEEFGLALARRGHTLVYGGYNAGLMGSGPGRSAGRRSGVAVVPKIFDQEGFVPAGCTQVFHVGTMSQRKGRMEAEADAFAVLPGGIGTYDEF